MDNGLKVFVVNMFQEDLARTTPEKRKEFLRILKFEPDRVLRVIQDNLCNWGMSCVVRTSQPVDQDFLNDPPECLKALQECFAAEMAAIES